MDPILIGVDPLVFPNQATITPTITNVDPYGYDKDNNTEVGKAIIMQLMGSVERGAPTVVRKLPSILIGNQGAKGSYVMIISNRGKSVCKRLVVGVSM